MPAGKRPKNRGPSKHDDVTVPLAGRNAESLSVNEQSWAIGMPALTTVRVHHQPARHLPDGRSSRPRRRDQDQADIVEDYFFQDSSLFEGADKHGCEPSFP
jgi:hypothetical protein